MKLSVPKRHIGKKLYTEIWKDIVGYEGKYMISNIGRVKSLNYMGHGEERVLKPRKTNKGYMEVDLYKDGKCKICKVHRLVALHFIDGHFEGAEIDHINTIKTDNRADNLRWVTHKENMVNPLTLQHRKGRKHSEETKQKISESKKGKHHSEANSRKVYCVELDKVYNSLSDASRELGIGINSICNHLHGRSKSTGGYHFYYVENILYKN